jgi:hypothetical protein
MYADIIRRSARVSRQPHDELGATPQPFATRFHCASVELHEPFHQRESEPKASLGAGCGPVGLREQVKDMGKQRRGNADSFVTNVQDKPIGLMFNAERKLTVLVAVFRRVAQQVGDDLNQANIVSLDSHRFIRHVETQPMAVALDHGAALLYRSPDHLS